jgi:peptide/nickel transport system permease protein
MSAIALPPSTQASIERPGSLVLLLRYLRRNKGLAIGLVILLALVAFTVIGLLTVNTKNAYPLSVALKKPPSWKYPFGTDFFGRDLLAAMVVGMWQTAFIGVLAGGLGTFIGVVLGFISAYFGGWIDGTIRTICQVLAPIPVLLIQVVIAGSLDKRDVTIVTMAMIVVLLAWMGPTLVIRAQVLTMKERQFVSVAKLSGVSDLGIIFKEILPCLLPFIAAAFVRGGVRGVLPRRAGARSATRAAARQHHLGRPEPGRHLQRLVVVADHPLSGNDPDPRVPRAHQYGAR